MKLVYGTILLAVLGFSSLTSAQEVAPDVLIRNVSSEVLDIVRKDKDIQGGNSVKAQELVEIKVFPHFNFAHMTQLALGKEWRQTNPEQQKSLAGEFRTLLVRTYSKALSEYRNETIKFKPFSLKPDETDARVRTEVRRPGGQPIEIDYFLEKLGTSWKVYDIEVGGVSLVTNYRESFGSEIRRGGVDGLIKTLQTKNKSGEVPAGKK